MSDSELVSIPGNWNFDYTYFAGATASRFFNELRLHRRIMGTRAKGGRVMVPARSFDDASYAPADEWVETGPGGTLEIFTIVGTKFPGLPDPPFVIAYVTLDGADTALMNYLLGVDLADIDDAARRLMARPRVKTVFREVREGRITDFWFELA